MLAKLSKMLSAGVYLPKALLATRAPIKESSAVYKKGELYNPPFLNEPDDYKVLRELSEKKLQDWLSSPTRFQSISERDDRSDVPAEANKCVSDGKYIMRYRGFDMCKCPQDLVLYHQLIAMVKPKTIIELGTLSGGMAVWMADTLKLLDIKCNIFSMDLDPGNLSEIVKKVKPENVAFLQGDSFTIEETLTPEFLSKLDHPWIFIEDAHANLPGVLRYFHQHCVQGDYMVVEDTCPELAFAVSIGRGNHPSYSGIGRKQLDCLRHFLEEFQDYYAVDSFFTDMFGYNGSWHWHGFIRKMK